MKILYVITGLGLGGAEKVVTDLADQMILRGHEVKIAYLKGDVVVKPTSEKIELICLGLESEKKIIAASQKYRQLIKQFQPDVVHAHMVHANIFTRLNRIGRKVSKLICTAHSSNEGGKIRMLAYKYTNFLSDFNTNVSQNAVCEFIRSGAFTQNNLCHVYNGIDLDYFKNNQNKEQKENISLLAVGRFNDAKDYPNLLKAITLVVQQYPNIHLNIAGDGELRSDIETLIEQLQISDNVTLLGRRNDIPMLMQQSDFFVLPSKYEGLPTVLIEAMASEIFVIATDCGGSKEIMGDTGILVKKEDKLALANGILQAIALQKEEIINNTAEARKRVEDLFSLDKSVVRWLDIYGK